MRASIPSLHLMAGLGLVRAATHSLIVSTYTVKSLYTLEFDDEALTLSLAANTSAPTASQWITLSHDKKNLYGTSTTATQTEFVSYTIDGDANNIVYNTTTVAGTCVAKTIHVEALQVEPYTVYGIPWYGDVNNCGGVMAVDEAGVIVEGIQNYTYADDSALHGLGFHPTGKYLYSADLEGANIWTHSVDSSTGEVTYVGNQTATGAPRHLAVHPSGDFLYVMGQESNNVSVWSLDAETGLATSAGVEYHIVPADVADSNSAATVRISTNTTHLYASTRGSGSDANGYVSGFTLNQDGTIASQDWIVATTTGGGGSNQVVPSLFDDSYFAIVDASVGFVEVWKRFDNNTGAAVVAHLDLVDGTEGVQCSTAVWYS